MKHFKKTTITALLMTTLVMGMVFPGVSAFAETQIVIAPPPITNPSFEKGKSDQRWDVTFLSMESDYFSAKGLGLDFTGRTPMSNYTAVDFQIGLFAMGGGNEDTEDTGPEMSMSAINIPMSLNFELQPIKTKYFNTILFAGGVLSITDSNTKIDGVESTGRTTMTGFQTGIQFGIQSKNFAFMPYFMSITQSGEYEDEEGEMIMEIEESTVQTIGFDIMHKPSGYTLSSIMNFASSLSEDDEEDVESTTIILKFGRRF